MSEENVTHIKRVYERWNRDRGIDPNAFHPEFEIRTPIMALENRRHRGYEGYKTWQARNAEVAADNWFEVDEFRDLGERVLVTGWIRVKGRTSGAESRDRAVQLWTFTAGKPSSMTAARTYEEALEAAGCRTRAFTLPLSFRCAPTRPLFGESARAIGPPAVPREMRGSRFPPHAARRDTAWAMSRESAVDKPRQVEALWDALNARDFATLGELLHPEGEFRSTIAAAEGGVYAGLDGLRKWAEDVDATWEGLRSEILEFHDAGEDRAVLLTRITGKAKLSGVPLNVVTGQVVTWGDGKAWRNETFPDPNEAFKAVGLSE